MGFPAQDVWAGLLGETFDVERAGSPLEMILQEVNLKSELARPESRRMPYSLVFRSIEPVVHPQSIYLFRHPRLTQGIEMFIVPIGYTDDRQGVYYEAVVN